MALTRPILEEHASFDATKSTTFKFISYGGDQFTRVKITIKRTTDNLTVYTHTYTQGTNIITLDANVLTNNNHYSIYINTYNANGDESPESNWISVLTLASPTLTRNNYSQGLTINGSQFTFETVYNQADGEPINIVEHTLFDETFGSIVKQETSYPATTTVPYTNIFIVEGLLNEHDYTYTIKVCTQHDMIIELSTNVNAVVDMPELNGILNLENMCEYGTIKIHSALKYIDGRGEHFTYKTEGGRTYADVPYVYDSRSRLLVYPYVTWDEHALEGSTLSEKKYSMAMWFKPDTKFGEHTPTVQNTQNIIINFGETSEYSERFQFIRSKLPDSTEYADYVVYYAQNGEIIVRSNYITDIGTSDDYYLMFFTKNDDTITLQLTKVIDNGDTLIYMNKQGSTTPNAHAYYNTFMNYKAWNIQSNPRGSAYFRRVKPSLNGNISSITLANGSYDHLILWNDVVEQPAEPTDIWDEKMFFNCGFNNNLLAGNVDHAEISDISKIVVKKRSITDVNWLTIYEKDVVNLGDCDFVIYDPYSANGITYIYSIVPVNGSGVEGKYYSKEIYSSFDGYFGCDRNNIFKMMVNMNYDATDTVDYGLIQPLNKKYPVIIQNGYTRYNKGTFNGAVMGYKYMKTRKLDKKDILEMRNDIVDFFNDGEIKVVKDWTGNVIVIQKIGDVTRSIDSQTGYSSIGFSWVEQGKIRDQNLYGKDGNKLWAIETLPPFIQKAEAEE